MIADLVLLSEHPDFRLTRMRYDQISEAERNAKTILRLLAVLEYPADEEPFPLLERLASEESADHVAGTNYSLEVIGAWRVRRWLGLCLSMPDGVDLLNWFNSHERAYHRLLWRLASDGVVELQTKLWRYLQTHRKDVRAWNTPIPDRSPEPIQVLDTPRSTHDRDQLSSSGTPYTVHVFEQNEAFARMMDDWLKVSGAAFRYGSGMPVRVERVVRDHFSRALPESGLIGIAHGGNLAIRPGGNAFQRELDHTLRELVNCYSWVVADYPNTMQQSAAIWISKHPKYVGAFNALALSCRSRIATYSDVTSLEWSARGAQFCESVPYGEAALVAAERDGIAPWLVISVSEHSGHWWRSAAAGLGAPAILGRDGGNDGRVLIAYRATDRSSYLELWRNFDRVSNVAFMTVSGRVSVSRLAGAIRGSGDRVTFQSVDTMADRCGWVYCHCFGGGPGEHHAMFSARDASVTRHVYAFVREREGRGYLRTGRW
ncbi:hypothetical protein [Tahibacter amnicola]|uniref:Uncharacterized protein n=1 Tax=Tahibacter amnicola TaxID=2976241 RepID=A0ABY6B9Q6_9GAMM|nr:hypothetical protein [Tahibacter amnicola]UXI66769.1 hypothetical protein N4264_18720 [Tahibacter amnicola]